MTLPRWLLKIMTYLSFGCLVGYIFCFAVPIGHLYSHLSPNERRKSTYHKLISRYFRFFAFHLAPKYDLQLRNPFKETFRKPALVIANHQSLLDLPTTLMLTPRMVVMTGQWVWNSRIYGKVVRYADFLPASMPLDEMVTHIRNCMERGYSVLIFPEGTRSEDCQIHTFRRGAFHIAEQLKCDVVPITIWGNGRFLPKDDFCIHPGRAVIEIGERQTYASGVMGEGHGAMTRYWHKWFVKRYAALEEELSR